MYHHINHTAPPSPGPSPQAWPGTRRIPGTCSGPASPPTPTRPPWTPLKSRVGTEGRAARLCPNTCRSRWAPAPKPRPSCPAPAPALALCTRATARPLPRSGRRTCWTATAPRPPAEEIAVALVGKRLKTKRCPFRNKSCEHSVRPP